MLVRAALTNCVLRGGWQEPDVETCDGLVLLPSCSSEFVGAGEPDVAALPLPSMDEASAAYSPATQRYLHLPLVDNLEAFLASSSLDETTRDSKRRNAVHVDLE